MLQSESFSETMTELCHLIISRYQNLSTEEAIVFAYVESAGRDGIWTKTIRSKSNLHQIVFTRCLKSLESKRLIKPTQSAKNPTRKLYILSHLQPFEEVSGGPFFTDGSIDEEFVRQLSFWLEQYVYKKSWYAHRPLQNGKVDNALSNDGNDAKHRVMNKDKRSKILPMAPGYIGYPKIPELTEAINQSGVSSVTLKEAEVRHILDLLCWDGRLTKVMNGQAYKKVLPTAPVADKEDSYVESPCGGCPVFDLCEEGGPVNARTCVYFQDWLNI